MYTEKKKNKYKPTLNSGLDILPLYIFDLVIFMDVQVIIVYKYIARIKNN